MASELKVPEIVLELAEDNPDSPKTRNSSSNDSKPNLPRDPSTYVLGDDIFDFLKPPEDGFVPTSAEMRALLLARDEARNAANKAYLESLTDFNEVVTTFSKLTMDVAKLKMDRIFAKYSKPLPIEIPAAETAPRPSANALPTGFGRKRSGGGGLGGSKKPKTPTSVDIPS